LHFYEPNSPWVLKGGTAVLARVHHARTTKDVDLYHQASSLDAALEPCWRRRSDSPTLARSAAPPGAPPHPDRCPSLSSRSSSRRSGAATPRQNWRVRGNDAGVVGHRGHGDAGPRQL